MTTQAPATPRTRLQVLRPAQVAEAIGVSVTTIWRMRRRGEFPEAVRLSPGAVGWRLTDVEAWLDARRSRQAA